MEIQNEGVVSSEFEEIAGRELEHVLKVVDSCQTQEQLESAGRYCTLWMQAQVKEQFRQFSEITRALREARERLDIPAVGP